MKKIHELDDSVKQCEFLARVERTIVATGANGSNYLIVNLVDKTGRVEGRVWNLTEEVRKSFEKANIIKITGSSNVYRNQLQIKINDFEYVNENDLSKYSMTMDDFIIKAPIDVNKMYTDLIKEIKSFKNSTYKLITIELLSKYEADFKEFPAAITIHHNLEGGLFWHSYSLYNIAKSLKDIYKSENIDWELLYCGAILHDIGKIIELNDKQPTDYSLEGKLIGHISIGNALIYKTAIDLDIYLDGSKKINADVTKLQHMIIASHGKNEFGSPIEPLLLESVILSSLDSLDARIYRVNDELNKIDINTYTPRVITEDGKSFLKHFSTSK